MYQWSIILHFKLNMFPTVFFVSIIEIHGGHNVFKWSSQILKEGYCHTLQDIEWT